VQSESQTLTTFTALSSNRSASSATLSSLSSSRHC
jgi:hypothetical protein